MLSKAAYAIKFKKHINTKIMIIYINLIMYVIKLLCTIFSKKNFIKYLNIEYFIHFTQERVTLRGCTD